MEPDLALQENILLTVPRRYFFCGSFMFFSVLRILCLGARLFLCLVITYWERADLFALACGVIL